MEPPSDRQVFRPELMAGALPDGGVAYSDSSAYAIKFTAPGSSRWSSTPNCRSCSACGRTGKGPSGSAAEVRKGREATPSI